MDHPTLSYPVNEDRSRDSLLSRVRENVVAIILVAFGTIALMYYVAVRYEIMGSLIGPPSMGALNPTPSMGYCTGPPYLYATVHDESLSPNVLKFSRNGCFLSSNVLQIPQEAESDATVEFRSLALGKYQGKEALYIVDASTHNSRVLVFGECSKMPEDYGQRPFITTAVDSNANGGLDHTYGICFDSSSNVYVSNQHTDNVLRFYKESFEPMPLPPNLVQMDSRLHYYDGTFVQFGKPLIHSFARLRYVWFVHSSASNVLGVKLHSFLLVYYDPSFPLFCRYYERHNRSYSARYIRSYRPAERTR
jgi:hypothetical protein